MAVEIYAGNLSYRMTEDSLKKIFEQYGEVTSIKIIKKPETDRSKGFGFVEMPDNEQAEYAIQKLNGSEVQGRNITVNVARPEKEGNNL